MTRARSTEPRSTAPSPEATPDGVATEMPSCPLVGIGSSAGGLEAVTELLRALPADTGLAFVVVQHMSPTHLSLLPEILGRETPMPVTTAEDAIAIEPDHVYVMPPDRDISVSHGVLRLAPRTETRGVHRPIDHFFESLATGGCRPIGVVLSGTGNDGALGIQQIKAAGGITFAQDVSARHDGMPRAAVATGCVDFVLSPREIAAEIVRVGQHSYLTTPSVWVADAIGESQSSVLARILRMLHGSAGVDFTSYKPNTLLRRIARRMVLQGSDRMEEYAHYLEGNPLEQAALFQDFLIGVTSFFRDAQVFKVIERRVLPALFAGRPSDDPVRVWVLGCSTGEEAYSIAIAITEFVEASGVTARAQIFATDLNEASVSGARVGIYPKSIEGDVSAARLERFFDPVDGRYRVKPSIREMCIFARHDALTAPPFSRMDLISCRNVLIYLEPELQQRLLPLLHFALRPEGFLLLGGSETVGFHQRFFDLDDAGTRLYTRKPGVQRLAAPLASPRIVADVGGLRTLPTPGASHLLLESDRILLARYAPPSVLITRDMEILQFRGDTGTFLSPAPGKPSLNLLKMAREGLVVGLRNAVQRAERENTTVRQGNLRVRSNGGWLDVTLEVVRVRESEGNFLVIFHAEGTATAAAEAAVPAGDGADRESAADERLATTLQELAATREYLQSVIDQQEATNEELLSSNEEMQSSNEELQSINEELETSKEEIQSSNEELATVNEELQIRNGELTQTTDDLLNVIASVQMALVIVGTDLRIRRFSPAAQKLLNLIPSDLNRSIAEIHLAVEVPDLERLLTEVMESARPARQEVCDRRGRWHELRVRPYRTLDDRIVGAVLVFVDVNELHNARVLAETVIQHVPLPLLVLRADLSVLTASRAFYEAFGVTPEHTEGCFIYDLDNRQWDIPDLRRLLEDILPKQEILNGYVVEHDFAAGRKTLRLNARTLTSPAGETPLILFTIEDITEHS